MVAFLVYFAQQYTQYAKVTGFCWMFPDKPPLTFWPWNPEGVFDLVNLRMTFQELYRYV